VVYFIRWRIPTPFAAFPFAMSGPQPPHCTIDTCLPCAIIARFQQLDTSLDVFGQSIRVAIKPLADMTLPASLSIGRSEDTSPHERYGQITFPFGNLYSLTYLSLSSSKHSPLLSMKGSQGFVCDGLYVRYVPNLLLLLTLEP
jgi:hypothetical protein